MTLLAAFLAAAVMVLTARPARAARRLRRIAHERDAARVESPSRGVVLAGALFAVLALGLAAGWWVGAVTGGLLAVIGRRRRSAAPDLDAPLLADLVAACLSAGASVPDALLAAADGCPEAAEMCRPVAQRLAVGAAPAEAWSGWLAHPDLAPMARACVRAADSGAATTEELRRAGERVRARRRAALAQRAHRAGVWAVLPLGVCFLPAFVLVGIVPFALGLFGR